MAVSSSNNRNRLSWSDEIGLLPLFLTLVLPIIIGVIVLLKCVYNHCCLRKATAKSYTVKPTLKSWKGTDTEIEDAREHRHQDISTNPTTTTGENETEPNRSGSVTNPNANQTLGSSAPERVVPFEAEENRPIPPRRTGSSQWRRSHPLVQNHQNSTNVMDNQVNFSGDSQDSRGYTRISVREPLSNIRSQAIRRNGDPHYATVSDDSEEMYAAIEDGDGNYMRIPGDEHDARHWQERREANSPLPPVPPPLSPVLLMANSESPTTSSSTGLVTSDPISTIEPPIYAQVIKVKKPKAPANPTTSLSTSAASSHSSNVPPDPPNEPPLPLPLPSTSSSIKKRSHHLHNTAVLDATDGPADSRRWSKADINYSEFEVVREPPFPSTSKSKSLTVELVDEDNYNIVQDVRSNITRTNHEHRPEPNAALVSNRPHPTTDPHHTYAELTKKSSDANHQGNDGYSEVAKRNSFTDDPTNHQHQYSDLKKRSSSPTDYYQEINERKPMKKRDNLYQKIRRKGGLGQGDESDEDDEDEEDQFYEKVKCKPIPLAEVDLPNHANPSALKHGYEKINPKTTKGNNGQSGAGPPLQLNLKPPDHHSPNPAESDEDGSLYEQVKYPPYERLNESVDDIRRDDEDGGTDNMYEDIGYSRINKSATTKSSQSQLVSSGGAAMDVGPVGSSSSPNSQDMDNLYARIDMTKKKRNTLQSTLPHVP